MPPSSNYFEFGVDKIGATLSTHTAAYDAVIRSGNNMMIQSGSGGSAVYIQKTNNKVGIGGNSTPGEALDVNGFVNSSSGYKIIDGADPGDSAEYKTVIDSSGNFFCADFIGYNAEINTKLQVQGQTLNVADFRVGIGTTDPGASYKLHVVGDTRIEGNLFVNGTSTIVNTDVQATTRLDITNDGTGPAAIIKQTGAQTILEVLDDENICFLIEDNGHVLVGGAANGDYQLDVSGNAHFIDNVDISQNLNVSGTLNVANNFYVATDRFMVDIEYGDTTVAGSLDVGLDFKINTDKFTVMYGAGDTYIGGTLDVMSGFTINEEKFSVDAETGNTSVAGTLNVANNFQVSDKFTVDTITGNAGLLGGLTVGANLNVADKFLVEYESGNATVVGTLGVDSDLNVNDNKFTVAASSGNTAVAGTLDLSGNLKVNNNKFSVTASSGNTAVAGTLDVSGNFAVDTDVLFVDVSNNKVGINDSTPDFELDVSGSIATNNAIMFNSSTHGAFAHRSNNTSTNFALLQSSAGKTIINCKAGAGNIEFKHGDGTVKQQFDSSGNVIIQGNLFSYSDARIKTNVQTIPNALDKVLSLRGVTYNMIKDVENDPENAPKHLGIIAQEVETVIPEAVKEENGIKTVAYGNIVGLLIEAIKEIKDQMNK
jgi:hypothetical protein